MFARFVLIVLFLGMCGCSSSTYIRAIVVENPLDRVAQQAQADWSVARVDVNTLHLSNDWPIHSFFALGYSASYANLVYDPKTAVLNLQYYFKSRQLPLLFIPFSLDAEPGFVGVVLKPMMNEQIDDLLLWSGASMISRRSGDTSEPFPPKDSLVPPSN